MDEELTPEQKFAAEDAETMVPKALMRGRCPEDIVAELIRLDWSPAMARALVARVMDDLRRYYQSPESRHKLVSEARWYLVGGIIMVLLGAGGTAFTLLAAVAGALPYGVVFFGLFFGGLIIAGQNWTRWRWYRGGRLPFEEPAGPE